MPEDEKKVVPLQEPPTKKTVVATAWPVSKFTVGEVVLTEEGTELNADEAKKAYEAAKQAGVKLVEKKKEGDK